MAVESRLELTDTFADACVKMAEGNPGALRLLTELAKHSPVVDPQCAFREIGPLISLDSFGIYGARIWMLYKDVCGGDGDDLAASIVACIKTLAVLRACQLGLISRAQLNHAIDNRGEGIDVDGLLEAVKAELDDFCIPLQPSSR